MDDIEEVVRTVLADNSEFKYDELSSSFEDLVIFNGIVRECMNRLKGQIKPSLIVKEIRRQSDV